MTTPLRIAIIAPGEMGHAVGARLRARGADVMTCLAGRTERSARRAGAAGMADVADDAALVRAADMFLSIVPPGVAVATAERIAAALTGTGAGLLYVDCNAVAPAPRFYASGPDVAAFVRLREHGLDVRAIGDEIGQASALKMSYGALTKGLTALAGELLIAARRGGVGEALARELRDSLPGLRQWIDGQLPKMPPKAYRWVAEMEEVAKTFDGCGLPGTTLRGAAEFYAFVAGSPLGQTASEVGAEESTADDVIAILTDACAARTGA